MAHLQATYGHLLAPRRNIGVRRRTWMALLEESMIWVVVVSVNLTVNCMKDDKLLLFAH